MQLHARQARLEQCAVAHDQARHKVHTWRWWRRWRSAVSIQRHHAQALDKFVLGRKTGVARKCFLRWRHMVVSQGRRAAVLEAGQVHQGLALVTRERDELEEQCAKLMRAKQSDDHTIRLLSDELKRSTEVSVVRPSEYASTVVL